MIKVTGNGGAGGARGTRGAGASRSSGGAFRVDETAQASGAAAGAAAETAAPSALGALIALQSEGRSGAKNRAMAERALMLLDRLRDGLLEGRIAVADLTALANAANAKLTDPDETLAALYGEIALRARVELAKLGRS